MSFGELRGRLRGHGSRPMPGPKTTAVVKTPLGARRSAIWPLCPEHATPPASGHLGGAFWSRHSCRHMQNASGMRVVVFHQTRTRLHVNTNDQGEAFFVERF